jgi:cytochrome P450
MSETQVREATGSCPHFQRRDPEIDGDKFYELYSELREHPVSWSEEDGGYWVVSRYEDIDAVLKDWETYSSAEGCYLPDSGWRSLGLELDPPDHGFYRSYYLAVAGRPVVEAKEDLLWDLTERVVGEFAAGGGGDVVKLVGEVLPVEAIALMAGLSAETAKVVREMSIEGLERMTEDPEAWVPLTELLLRELESRRGQDSTDFLTTLANAEVEGRPMNDEEKGNILVSAIVAGHETSMNASANLMLYLAQDRELQDRLRENPDLIPRVCEESLRHRAPVHFIYRTLTKDATLGGTQMRAGDKLMVIYPSANRDSAQFGENADEFDPGREGILKHLTFGTGIHRCVGAPLAQAELRLLAKAMVARGPFELAGDVGPALLDAGSHVGFKSLPLRFV